MDERRRRAHQYLRRSGLTQNAWARALGIDKSYLSLILSGKRVPKLALACRMADALRLSPRNLPAARRGMSALALAGVIVACALALWSWAVIVTWSDDDD